MLRSNGLKLLDGELVKQLREADADAAEALVDTCGARAYRLAVRITGSEADAKEVAQDALWSVVCRVEMFRGDSVPTIARANTTRKGCRPHQGKLVRETPNGWSGLNLP